MPQFPRGPRRAKPDRETRLLGIPRISPEWELNALRTLMKPQATLGTRHLSSDQPRPRKLESVVAEVRQLIADRLLVDLTPHLPQAGDFWLAMDVPRALSMEALAFAVLLSRRLAGIWVVVDRIFVRDGQFYRRERGYKLRLVLASNVHLTRAIRSALRGNL